MYKKIALVLFCLHYACCCLAVAELPEQLNDPVKVYNISDFGAIGDSATINTGPINDAIATCASNGGGVVLVSGGTFVTGTIVLQSNVILHLDNKAVILGTNDTGKYKSFNLRRENPDRPVHLPVKGNSRWSRSLILFDNVLFRNLAITYHIADESVLKTSGFERPRTESRPLPFWGFYVRNVHDIAFENVHLDYTGTETRPMLGFDNVDYVQLSGLSYRLVPGVDAFRYSGATKVTNVNSKPLN